MTDATERKYILLSTRSVPQSDKILVGLASRHDDFLTHQEATTMRSKMMRPATVMLAEAADANGKAAIEAYLSYVAGDAPSRFVPAA